MAREACGWDISEIPQVLLPPVTPILSLRLAPVSHVADGTFSDMIYSAMTNNKYRGTMC